MTEKTYQTPCGTIHYWVSEKKPGRHTLVLLPGLTADHRLFTKQTEYFAPRETVLVWDAPGHGASRPFALDFSLADKAAWLHGILEQERLTRPVLVGQSMGGYVAQSFLQAYPGEAAAFVSIDSAPLQRQYITAAELWLLKRCEPVYRCYPWKSLIKTGANGCSETPEGRAMMRAMMESYTPWEYSRLAGHGFRILAEAIEAELPYRIDCPALLLCGEKDQAGSARRYNRAWAAKGGLPLVWLAGAGHNSNVDRPEEVNAVIGRLLNTL